MEVYRELARTLTVGQLIEELFARTGYLAAVGAMPDGARCRDDLLAFAAWAANAGARGLSALVRAMDAAKAGSGVQAPSIGQSRPGCVSIMTVHRSKGLEFPVVYLVGLEEGILPHKRSLEDGNCDEERRLLYVGITRAQEKLMLTYCATRLRYGDRMPCQRSSFLSEIPPHLMDYSKWEDLMNAEATEEESGNFFDSLRSMLLEDE